MSYSKRFGNAETGRGYKTIRKDKNLSADNGIYVLHTKGPEYRVKYAHNIDSIYGKFNDETGHYDGNFTLIKKVFEKCKIFKNLDDALAEASEMSYEYPYLEDGICVISDFKDKDFSNL